MTLPASPPLTTPSSVRRGSTGWLVYAVQRVLGQTPDGIFGPLTDRAVRDDQARAGITVDGIVGPVTQRVYARAAIAHGEAAAQVPAGLLRGIVESESGLMLAAVNWGVAGGVDCGVTQRRVLGPPYSIAALRDAFDPSASTRRTALELAVKAREFVNPHSSCPFTRWELAALNHNWPSAAFRFHRYGGLGNSAWRVATWAPASLQPITWDGWARFYVRQATRYVT